jgi:S1-C subfamily serine protease
MKKLSRSLVLLGSGILIYLAGVFGTSVLSNLHLKYLRNLGSNVVLIHNLAGSGATGFLVKGKSGKLYVMTNNHVCELEQDGTVLGTYQGDVYVLEVVKRYMFNDLCVLAAPGTATKYMKIAKSYELGETAYVLGHPQLEPLSLAVGELSDLVTINIIVKSNGTQAECSGPTYTYHTDDLPLMAKLFGITSMCSRSLRANSSSITISPGNSGSPVLNIWGSVVAVTFAANESGTRSYHVPLYDLVRFLEDL